MNEEELKAFYFEHFPDIKYIMEEFIQGDLISFDGITNGDAEVIFSSNEVFPEVITFPRNSSGSIFTVNASLISI